MRVSSRREIGTIMQNMSSLNKRQFNYLSYMEADYIIIYSLGKCFYESALSVSISYHPQLLQGLLLLKHVHSTRTITIYSDPFECEFGINCGNALPSLFSNYLQLICYGNDNAKNGSRGI